MAISKTIEEIYDYFKIRKKNDARAVQWIGNNLFVDYPVESRIGQVKLEKYKNLIVGVYDNNIQFEDLKEDVNELIKMQKNVK